MPNILCLEEFKEEYDERLERMQYLIAIGERRQLTTDEHKELEECRKFIEEHSL